MSTRSKLLDLPEYRAWSQAKNRCYNPKSNRYSTYGGRGIVMCDRWRESFSLFLHDMGAKPSSLYSLDRQNNDLGYTPENCRWALRSDQMCNRTDTRRITLDGVEKHLAQWCREKGLKAPTVCRRVRRGWSYEEALTTSI